MKELRVARLLIHSPPPTSFVNGSKNGRLCHHLWVIFCTLGKSHCFSIFLWKTWDIIFDSNWYLGWYFYLLNFPDFEYFFFLFSFFLSGDFLFFWGGVSERWISRRNVVRFYLLSVKVELFDPCTVSFLPPVGFKEASLIGPSLRSIIPPLNESYIPSILNSAAPVFADLNIHTQLQQFQGKSTAVPTEMSTVSFISMANQNSW